jgi:hypothetical protein
METLADADYDCATYDDTTMVWVASTYLESWAAATSTSNTAGTSYNYAYDAALGDAASGSS